MTKADAGKPVSLKARVSNFKALVREAIAFTGAGKMKVSKKAKSR